MTDVGIILDIRETAAFLRISEKTVRRLIQRGELRASRVGCCWRIRRRDIEAYLESGANVALDDCLDAALRHSHK